MRRKSEPGGRAGLAPKPTTHPLFFLLLLVMTSDKSSPPPPPPLPICFRRRGQANIINPLAPWKQILDRHMHCNSKFEQKSSAPVSCRAQLCGLLPDVLLKQHQHLLHVLRGRLLRILTRPEVLYKDQVRLYCFKL